MCSHDVRLCLCPMYTSWLENNFVGSFLSFHLWCGFRGSLSNRWDLPNEFLAFDFIFCFLKIIYLFLFCLSEYFALLYVYVWYSQKPGHQIWKWCYRCLWAATWMLRTKPGSSARVTRAFIFWALSSLQSPQLCVQGGIVFWLSRMMTSMVLASDFLVLGLQCNFLCTYCLSQFKLLCLHSEDITSWTISIVPDLSYN